MKQTEFWKQAEARSRENAEIVKGGASPRLARTLALVGLSFWKVGLLVSFVTTLVMWKRYADTLIQVARVMVWR